MSSMEKECDGKELMVIDTDCGVDDALAIMLALNFKETWKILAITCVSGNTSVDNACNNVLKVLHLYGETQVPVYRGCDRPMVSPPQQGKVHGSDGLGNVAHEFSSGDLRVSNGHAVNVLTELARDYKGRINLVALAPLTNIAMAHRMDPEFTTNLKSLTFMGGNIHGVGNTTSAAEFNFYYDPEAAHVVLSETQCPVTMVPWETTLENGMEWKFYDGWKSLETAKSYFVKKITDEYAKAYLKRKREKFNDCDVLAVAALVLSDSVMSLNRYPVTVELFATHTRGQAVIKRKEMGKNVKIITGFNVSVLNVLRMSTVK